MKLDVAVDKGESVKHAIDDCVFQH